MFLLQLLNERLMGAEGTKMDEDFLKMEKVKEWDFSLCPGSLNNLTDFLSTYLPACPPDCCCDLFSAGWAAVQNYRVPPTKPRYWKKHTVLNTTPLLSWNTVRVTGDPNLLRVLCGLTADRAKLSVLNTMSRIRGRGRSVGYPQTEWMLGDCMLHYGQELGAASEFGTTTDR